MKKKLYWLFAFSALLLFSCSGNKKTEEQRLPDNSGSKTLVLYYSQTGTTKSVAEEIQRLLGAEIDSIVAEESYGYDYDATIKRWRKEKEDSVKVAIKPLHVNFDDYETIFLGFPIWGGTYASPVASFLADNLLEGKSVVTFATFGSGGLEGATNDVASAWPDADVVEGYGVRNARISKAPEEIRRFLIANGYMDGEISSIPEYGNMHPVTPEETEIFNKACGDYKFPLGTPYEVSKRSYDGVTDYKYEVKSVSPDGRESRSIIYVIVPSSGEPEFTRVVRL